jgi:Holliday junction resolvasome RuvABC endonuclease subunit
MAKRISLEEITEECNNNQWDVISEEYKNLKTLMTFSCPEGHIVYKTWEKLRNDFVCEQCEKTKAQKSLATIQPKKKGVKRILALDDATNTTGWAIFDDKQLVTYGKITFTQNDVIERISKLRQWLIDMINSWRVDKVAIEDIQLQKFQGKNGHTDAAVTTYKALAQLQGVLLVTCFENNISCTVVHTATWRAHCKITAKQRADQKRAAQLLVKRKYDRDCTQDEADAICIGTYMVEKYMRNNEMIDFASFKEEK